MQPVAVSSVENASQQVRRPSFSAACYSVLLRLMQLSAEENHRLDRLHQRPAPEKTAAHGQVYAWHARHSDAYAR